MKRISVFIAERQYERFQELSRTYGQPYAELIREALNDYLQRREAPGAAKKAERKRADTRRRS